jgi:hypothetical protein
MRRSTTTALVAALPATGVTPVLLTGPAAAAPAKHYDDWGGLPD